MWTGFLTWVRQARVLRRLAVADGPVRRHHRGQQLAHHHRRGRGGHGEEPNPAAFARRDRIQIQVTRAVRAGGAGRRRGRARRARPAEQARRRSIQSRALRPRDARDCVGGAVEPVRAAEYEREPRPECVTAGSFAAVGGGLQRPVVSEAPGRAFGARPGGARPGRRTSDRAVAAGRRSRGVSVAPPHLAVHACPVPGIGVLSWPAAGGGAICGVLPRPARPAGRAPHG